jgi:hypothetical protein
LWDSGLNVTLNLTAKTDSTALIGEIAGVLRVNDTDHLNWVSPPPNLISGQLYVVWMSTALRWNSSTGLLEFSLPGQEENVSMLRREADGTWISVPGTWNRSTHILTYSPTDLHLMNGTFAIVYDETLTVYVAPDGQCNGNNPCYSTIQEAIASEYDGVIIKIAQGDYDEDLVLGLDKDLRLEGGWDSEFTTQSSYTAVNSITISNGTVAVDRLVIQ